MIKKTKLHILGLFCLSACAAMQAAPENFSPAVQQLWLKLGATPNDCDDLYDYFPGGLRILYCHARTQLNYQQIQKLVGRKAFRSGPHSEQMLVLDSRDQFGHYDPAFVNAVAQAVIPRSSAAIQMTQPVYDQYLKELARIHYLTYQKWQRNPQHLQREIKDYQAAIRSNSLDKHHHDRFYFFMNPGFFEHVDNDAYFYENGADAGFDGNVVKTAAAFWVRRSIDNTQDEFFKALQQMLKTYDPELLKPEAH